MKLIKGLRRDEITSKAISSSWRDSKNMQMSNGFKSIENEKGFKYLDIQLSYNLIGMIELPIGFVVFSTDDITTEIGIYSDETYTPILRSDFFGHTISNPIEGVYRYNYKDELIISWCDGITTGSNVPYLMNLTEYTILNVINTLSEYEIERVKLFPKFVQATFELVEVESLGGSLKSGIYYFAIQYLIDGEDFTNFTELSNAVSVVDSVKIRYDIPSSSQFIYNQKDGSPADTFTSKVIILKISNLDTKYSKFRLAVIKKANSVTTGYLTSVYDIIDNSIIIEHSGNESTILPIDINEILVNKAHYSKVKTMTINNNRLLIGNLKSNDDISYQKFANLINVNWIYDYTISLDSNSINGSYKDEVTIFNNKGFMAGEVYCLYIAFPLKSGGYSKAFIIPGREFIAGDKDELSGAGYTTETDYIDDDYVFKSFQLEDTSDIINGDTVSIIGAAVNNSDGTVKIPTSAPHGFILNNYVKIENTVSPYNGTFKIVNIQDTSSFDITITYTAEVFAGDDQATEIFNYGIMGYWENQNEIYPRTDSGDFISTVDYNGDMIYPINLDNVTVIDLGGIPNEVRIPCTNHGLNVGDSVYQINTINYNGIYIITNINDVNTYDIESAYTAETFTGGGEELTAKVIDLEYTPTRHHRFPMLRTLAGNEFPYYTGILDKAIDSLNINFGTPIVENVISTYPSSVLGFENQISEYGYFKKLVVSTSYANPIGNNVTRQGGTGAEFVATQVINNFIIDYNIVAAFNCPYIIDPLKEIRGGLFLVTTIGGTITVIASDYQTFAASTTNLDLSISGSHTIPLMNPGDTIEIFGVANLNDNSIYPNGFYSGSITGSGFTNSSVSGSTFSKVLGLKVSNVIIPDEIKDNILGWKIFYAERTFSNSTVIAQGRKIKHDTDKYYMHPFDLLKNHELPSVNPNYLIHESYTTLTLDSSGDRDVYLSDVNNVISIPSYSGGADEALRATSNIKYLPRDNSISEPSNEFNEMRFYGEANDTTQDSNTKIDNILVTLYSFKKNLYYPFVEQRLISTGKLNLISTSSPYNIKSLYGGDTFVNMYGVRRLFNTSIAVTIGFYSSTIPDAIIVTTASNHGLIDGDSVTITDSVNYNGTFEVGYISPTTFYVMRAYFSDQSGNVQISSEEYYSIFCQSTANIGFRHEGNLSKQEVYYPKKDKIDTTVIGVGVSQKDVDSYFGYNNDYSSLNDKNILIIEDFNRSFTSTFPYRIAISNIIQNESDSIGWRYFLPNSYHESVRNKGEIIKLFSDDLNLGISHKFSLFIASLKSTLNISNDVVASLGNADLFDTPPQEIIIDKDGYVGNQCQFATITCKIGTILIDRQQGKIFIYDNKQVKEISNIGLRSWFKNNLQYSTTDVNSQILPYQFDDNETVNFDDSEIMVYGRAISVDSVNYNLDNPFNNKGYTCAWDDENERLIISKREYIEGVDYSYTISYNPNTNGYIAFHDYFPIFIVNNRNGLYSFDTNNKLYIHNSSNYCTFYDDIVYPSYIDVIFNTPESIDKLFKSFNWESLVFDGDNHKWDNTFTQLVIFTHNRHSNKIQLVKQTFDAGNIRETGGTWKFNSFRDLLNDKDYEVIKEFEVDELSEETLDSSRLEDDWTQMGYFINEFIIIRLIYDNVDQNKILLTNINVEQDIKRRL